MYNDYIFYYIILLIACVLTFVRVKHDKKLLVFAILLTFTLVQEIVSESLEFGKRSFLIYHLFVPVYYSLFTCYLSSTIPRGKPKNLMRLSIPFFIVLSAIISCCQKNNIMNFPGVQLNIMSVFLITDSMAVLFLLDVRDRTPLFRRPIFWISISTMFFYAALFSLDGFVNYLIVHNPKLSNELTVYLNINLNYLYYLLVIIGMLCSKPKTKYSLQSY